MEMNPTAKKVAIASVAVLLLVGFVYGVIRYSRYRQFASLKEQMVATMTAAPRGGPPNPEVWRQMGELREQAKELPESYRNELRQTMGRVRESRDEQRMMAYFKLSAAERVKELDKRIAEDVRREKERAARRAAGGNRGGGPQANNAGGPPGGPGGGPPGGPGGPGGGGPPGGWRGGGGPAGRLDSTSPQQRAMRNEYRRDMAQRRAQLGIPPSGAGRR